MSPREKLQELLARLFRLDEPSDLDFGIHRVVNLKREDIRRYLNAELPKKISDILARSAAEVGQSQTDELRRAQEQVHKDLGETALDPDGNLRAPEFAETPPGLRYLRARAAAAELKSAAEMEEEIYDRLAGFFARYECGGDIVPRRRHSLRNHYAVPHNGEEVLLHWANREQYYVKTAAFHAATAFKVGGKRFRFKIAETRDAPRDNNKDSGRLFFPQVAQAGPDESGDIVVPFVLRAPTADEKARLANGKNGDNGNGGNGARLQPRILNDALAELQAAAKKKPALRPLLAVNDGGDEPAFARHARRFVRRNTSDFFIHRNLRKFLNEELDLYLNSEVLSAGELPGVSVFAVASRMVVFRAVRELGRDIADFLAQWEDLQKSLWEKKKFVLATEYCATVGSIPKAEKAGLLDDIAGCEKQWDEWKALGINGDAAALFSGKGKREKRLAFLRENPTLPVDTANFPPEFKDRLLAQFPDIDDATDGVLIHGENWQALNLVGEMYRGRVQCVYIDPPYNTGPSEILYMNDYKHSSWLSLMEGRIVESLPMLDKSGVYVVAIDENEQEFLGVLLTTLFPEKHKTCVSVVHNPSGQQSDNFSLCHEHAYFVYPQGGRFIGMKNRDDNADVRPLRDVSKGDHLREDAANCFYPIFVKDGEIIGFGDVCDDSFHPAAANVAREDGIVEVYPIDAKGTERKWVFARKNVESIAGELAAKYNKQRDIWDIIRTKTVFNHKTVWDEKKYSANSYGAKLLGDMGVGGFSFPKSVYTVMDCVDAALCGKKNAHVVDYFAGSGTTAHAVINLNREDGGRRKFVLAEMGKHFNTALLPRVKKVIFAPEWKDGKADGKAKPDDFKRGPRLVKYQRIESYEDALANIRFERDGLETTGLAPRYELEWESRRSPTRLSDDGLESPFSYRLELNGEKSRTETADLPETFAYLIGLRVRERRTTTDEAGRRYLIQRGDADGRKTAVIWRDVSGWGPADFERDRDFIAREDLTGGAARVLLNGNSVVRKSESLNGVFGERMFAEGEEGEGE